MFSFIMSNLSEVINHTSGVNTTWLDPRRGVRDQVFFLRCELSQQLQMSAFHPAHLECPTFLNTAPTGMTQHPNNQPPMEQPLLKLGAGM